MQVQLPEAILARFRALSLERVGRIDALWNALIEGADDEEAARTILHNLHTLKGDARMVGYDAVHTLAHKLEELVGLAEQLEYRISDDFELVVSMSTQFLGMLLRKRDTAGIDLAGFMRQIEEVLRETRVLRKTRPTNPRMAAVSDAVDRLSEHTRQRLASVATDAFLEYLGARNRDSRMRLRRVWQTLRDELAQIESVAIAPLIDRHVAATRELAAALGKAVELEITLDDLRLDPRVAEAVDQAILHLLRNAIDHGIETPAERAASGKPAHGTVRISVEHTGSNVKIVVADDGRGLDLERVRAKGSQRELLDRNGDASERELVDLLFLPGFSTRDVVDEISGRGIGMDAVKSAIVRVGGDVRLHTKIGAGVDVTLVVPAPVRHMRVYRFLAPGGSMTFAVSARWTPTLVDDVADLIDPVQAVALHGGSRQTITGWTADSMRDVVMQLRWGFLELALRTGSEPQLMTAERICPTADDCPLEVVLIDGVEALLIRPEHVKTAMGRGASREP